MRTREARIRTFMQLELEACLEEINWMIRCHNCEALNCPQEEYPARLFPTPPPSYIDNLQSRLIKVRKGIFPASLKIILNTNYPLPVRRPAPETSVQPDDVRGEDRAGENSPSSQCDPLPRRAAVDTGSEEPGTPPRSPAMVRGQDPEYRESRRKWRRKKFSLSKPIWMVFCIQIAQAPSRSVFHCFSAPRGKRQ